MSTFWSDYVQGVKALDYDRRRRIRDEHKDLYVQYLGLKPDSIVVDIGCGPGTFSRKISRWLAGQVRIIGIERDRKFVDYARAMAHQEKIDNVQYIEADAMSLPLEDNSVDACCSIAVIQFVNPEEFLLEQRRVCRPGGAVAVMNIIPGAGYCSHDDCLPEKSQREQELWDCLVKEGDETLEEWNLSKYEVKPSQYPHLLDRAGFKDIEVNAIPLFYAPDDARNSLDKKIEIIEADRQNDLEVVEIACNHLRRQQVSDEAKGELIGLINQRHDRRVDWLKSSKQLWEFKISTLLIVKGIK